MLLQASEQPKVEAERRGNSGSWPDDQKELKEPLLRKKTKEKEGKKRKNKAGSTLIRARRKPTRAVCSGWSYPIQAEGALLLGGVPPVAQLSGMDGEVGASLVRIDGVLGLAVVSAALQKLHKCVTQNTTELLQDTERTSSTTAAWTGQQSRTGGAAIHPRTWSWRGLQSPPQVLEETAVQPKSWSWRGQQSSSPRPGDSHTHTQVHEGPTTTRFR